MDVGISMYLPFYLAYLPTYLPTLFIYRFSSNMRCPLRALEMSGPYKKPKPCLNDSNLKRLTAISFP